MSFELKHLRLTINQIKSLPVKDAQNYMNFYNSLTSEELQTISDFTEYYETINSKLRNGTLTYHPIMDLFEKAPPLENSVVVWRSTTRPPDLGTTELKGIGFASLDPLLSNSPVEENSTILEIDISCGNKILLWNETMEQEVLLNHNTMAEIKTDSDMHVDALGNMHPKLFLNLHGKQVGGSGLLEMVHFEFNLVIYNNLGEYDDLDEDDIEVINEWYNINVNSAINNLLLEDRINIINFVIERFQNPNADLSYYIQYEVDPDTLDGLDINTINEILTDPRSQLYFYNNSFHINIPPGMEIPDEDIYFGRGEFL